MSFNDLTESQLHEKATVLILIAGYTYERLDGSVRGEERYLAVNNFNESDDTFLFMLSTKAGKISDIFTGLGRRSVYFPPLLKSLCSDLKVTVHVRNTISGFLSLKAELLTEFS